MMLKNIKAVNLQAVEADLLVVFRKITRAVKFKLRSKYRTLSMTIHQEVGLDFCKHITKVLHSFQSPTLHVVAETYLVISYYTKPAICA